MTAKIIDGKAIAQKIRENLKDVVQRRLTQGQSASGLAVILVGDDPASHIYVRNKREACSECGIKSVAYDLPQDISQEKLLSLITQLNSDTSIHGILIQLPLPKHIKTPLILDSIDPKKDVDGFHPTNLGLLAQGRPYLRPCTPYGVMRLLEHEKITLPGLNAVVVGTSNIVGKPMALELVNAKCTVTLCHKQTRDLQQAVKQADLLVSAIGKAGVIKSEWIKPGAIVIDIGITRSPNGKLHGDIEFETAKQSAAYITPVPGGVGPMTVAMLLSNTLLAANIELS
ncbi:bifunctional methylenetetrahydrofolate dehydrogenase/methenyltetrahydrofolate cyclohydrolase FolD [Rickettsiella endosymbiont of Dermanyssus gallinae]|uniref:bifunctional methylenetetrahydrofolate dehydrogenase/methenyltetrahydrofolate cyclohydrolase FolD n=1 Tax=Rickettsiella endosymbiont of Dermanyssus gallinae TaxID=2856608 RepID=UPI001C52A642|nr:bifunctional methylenetetrahydrofolate dehydrogenase/methenyltetrahydrofolate cyclohydrolase FolD [Rickettsiella endosymbiont of Dermanyssus gallinae]